MARPLRIEYDGALYHVTSRGNEKREIFLDDEDRLNFLEILKKVNEKYNWLCHAYCLMNNHYHLVIETPDGNLSKGMRQLNGVYTQFFNKKYSRVGHLFQGRYKAILINKDSHLLEVCRYVVLNPVRAGIVNSPEQWIWSSYMATAGLEKPHSCLTAEWVLKQFSDKRDEAIKRYREFVFAGIGKESIWKALKAQILLGDDEFVERFEEVVKKKAEIKEIPKSQRFILRPSLDEIFKERVNDDRSLRDEKIFEAVVKYGYSQNEIAEYLGMHYSTVSKALRKIKTPKFKT